MKKRLLALGLCVLTVLSLSGCGDNEMLKQERESLKTEIGELTAERDSLKNEVAQEKIDNGTAIYVVTINISQKHYNVSDMVKDMMNDVDIQIPVSKEFYDSVEPGTVLDDSFRMGSFVMNGSFGSWDIEITDKEIQ